MTQSLSPTSSFDSTDVWVLQSIHYAGQNATLLSIIGAGDYLNHAVLSFDEFSSSFAKLNSAELVAFEGGTFSVSRLFLAWYKKKFAKRKSVSAALEYKEVLHWLSTDFKFAPEKKPAELPFNTIEFTAAIEQYTSGR